MRGTQCSQSDGRDKTLACHLIGKTEPCAQKILSQGGHLGFSTQVPLVGSLPAGSTRMSFSGGGLATVRTPENLPPCIFTLHSSESGFDVLMRTSVIEPH